MWQQGRNDPSFHYIERNHFRLGVSTRAKNGILEGRVCSWNVTIYFHHWNYGYVQINNAFVGTLNEAKQYAENELRNLKEDMEI